MGRAGIACGAGRYIVLDEISDACNALVMLNEVKHLSFSKQRFFALPTGSLRMTGLLVEVILL